MQHFRIALPTIKLPNGKIKGALLNGTGGFTRTITVYECSVRDRRLQARTSEAVIRMTYAFAAVGKSIGVDERKMAIWLVSKQFFLKKRNSQPTRDSGVHRACDRRTPQTRLRIRTFRSIRASWTASQVNFLMESKKTL